MMSVYSRALVPTEARPDSREDRLSLGLWTPLGETASMDLPSLIFSLLAVQRA